MDGRRGRSRWPAPPGTKRSDRFLMEQGRLYTSWLYGSEYEKLWDSFSPDMRQTFGSVADLASFAGRAVGPARARSAAAVDERVEAAEPLRIYSRTRHVRQGDAADAAGVEPGPGRRGDRRLCSGPTRRSVDPAAQRHLALHREQHYLARLARQPEHQHLRAEARDVALAEVDGGDTSRPTSSSARIERAELRARALLPQRTEIDPELVRRLAGALVRLRAEIGPRGGRASRRRRADSWSANRAPPLGRRSRPSHRAAPDPSTICVSTVRPVPTPDIRPARFRRAARPRRAPARNAPSR